MHKFKPESYISESDKTPFRRNTATFGHLEEEVQSFVIEDEQESEGSNTPLNTMNRDYSNAKKIAKSDAIKFEIKSKSSPLDQNPNNIETSTEREQSGILSFAEECEVISIHSNYKNDYVMENVQVDGTAPEYSSHKKEGTNSSTPSKAGIYVSSISDMHQSDHKNVIEFSTDTAYVPQNDILRHVPKYQHPPAEKQLNERSKQAFPMYEDPPSVKAPSYSFPPKLERNDSVASSIGSGGLAAASANDFLMKKAENAYHGDALGEIEEQESPTRNLLKRLSSRPSSYGATFDTEGRSKSPTRSSSMIVPNKPSEAIGQDTSPKESKISSSEKVDDAYDVITKELFNVVRTLDSEFSGDFVNDITAVDPDETQISSIQIDTYQAYEYRGLIEDITSRTQIMYINKYQLTKALEILKYGNEIADNEEQSENSQILTDKLDNLSKLKQQLQALKKSELEYRCKLYGFDAMAENAESEYFESSNEKFYHQNTPTSQVQRRKSASRNSKINESDILCGSDDTVDIKGKPKNFVKEYDLENEVDVERFGLIERMRCLESDVARLSDRLGNNIQRIKKLGITLPKATRPSSLEKGGSTTTLISKKGNQLIVNTKSSSIARIFGRYSSTLMLTILVLIEFLLVIVVFGRISEYLNFLENEIRSLTGLEFFNQWASSSVSNAFTNPEDVSIQGNYEWSNAYFN